MHFCLRGNSKFLFNDGAYSFDVLDNRSILLYNPQRTLPINLEIQPKTTLISLLISIEKFHSLFSKEANHIHFLSDENINRKYYNDDVIKPSVLIVLQQIINSNVNNSLKELFIKGKIYELLSLHFQKEDTANVDSCPFLVDEDNVLKIRKAKDIIISRMAEPPSLQELSTEIGLTLKKLKELGLSYVLNAKPGSHPHLFKGIEKRKKTGRAILHTVEEEIGDKADMEEIKEDAEAQAKADEVVETGLKLPAILPQTGTSIAEKGIKVYANSAVATSFPTWLKASSLSVAPTEASHWINTIPYTQDRDADSYIVIPTT